MDVLCVFEECDRFVVVKKDLLCFSHYQQKRAGKKLTALRKGRQKPRCPIPGCQRFQQTRGLCAPHASVCWRMSLSEDSYKTLMEDRWCYLCEDRAPSVHLDHDHSCCPGNQSCGGCLRGTLCLSHNLLLGHYEKNGGYLEGAGKYLEGAPWIAVEKWKPITVDSHRGRKQSKSSRLSP